MHGHNAHRGPVDERFWARVDRAGNCWEWRGPRDAKGYGLIRMQFGENIFNLAHRLAYALAVGPIPGGLAVCHRCDNPPCCRPDHLFLGTLAENNRDMAAKGRQATGERGGGAVLSDQQAAELRRRVLENGERQRVIAREFGIDPSTVSLIVRGKRRAP